jgi:hypothetical protein
MRVQNDDLLTIVIAGGSWVNAIEPRPMPERGREPPPRYLDKNLNRAGLPVHDDRAIFQGRIDELAVIDIHSL